MSMFDDLPADEHLHQALAGNSTMGGDPPPAPGEAQPQAAQVAEPTQLAPGTTPQPTLSPEHFTALARAMQVLTQTLSQAQTFQAPQPQAPAVKPPHIDILERLTASEDPEKAALAVAALEVERRRGAEQTELKAQLERTTENYNAERERQEQAGIDQEVQEVQKRYGFAPEESERVVAAWEQACANDERAAFLTFEEFATRLYGRDKMEVRRQRAVAAAQGQPQPRPAGQVLTNPQSGGGAPQAWSPPRERNGKPHVPNLEDARQAAYRRLGVQP